MTARFATAELVREAVSELGRWRLDVQQQTSSHLYSFLAPKWKGALPGQPLSYSESDDHEFWNTFFRIREGAYPYFDPLKSEWRPRSQGHSNTATQRKNRFVGRWHAATWSDDVLTLSPNYAEIFVQRVLTKGGRVTRVPAEALAVWLFKTEELPGWHELPGVLQERFHFSDPEFATLFATA